MASTRKQKIRQDPAYQLYTADFLVRNLDMTDEQVGRYVRLLCFQHQNGHMTKDIMISFCNGTDEKVFSKFLLDSNGLYFNEEMGKEVERRAEISQTKTDSANKRWEKEKLERESQLSDQGQV